MQEYEQDVFCRSVLKTKRIQHNYQILFLAYALEDFKHDQQVDDWKKYKQVQLCTQLLRIFSFCSFCQDIQGSFRSLFFSTSVSALASASISWPELHKKLKLKERVCFSFSFSSSVTRAKSNMAESHVWEHSWQSARALAVHTWEWTTKIANLSMLQRCAILHR